MDSYRIESDLLGDFKLPNEVYYGVQTLRAIHNFKISNQPLFQFPLFVKSIAQVKLAAAKANFELNILPKGIFEGIKSACEEIIDGELLNQFPVDMVQGGAGTSVNMNANEVIANRALEIMGHQKGEYQFCSPNDHVNLSQSTNDAYPTALKIAVYQMNKRLIEALHDLMEAFHIKSIEFQDILKIGRTQLQDAVPMTLGMEFKAFSFTLEKEIYSLEINSHALLEINMGATAIGTGLNSVMGYSDLCTKNLAEILKEDITSADNLMEATSDTGSFVAYSDALKRIALKLSKICNDLRLLSSGPRAGFQEINLPAVQPGSSIMPGKVNPVIPEVVNQVCFKVIGNNLTVSLASEAGQLQLNAMEPIIAQSLMESIVWLENGMNTLNHKCIKGITANEESCKQSVLNSIGIVTSLNPYLGYKNCSKIAVEALETGRSIYDVVIESKLLSRDQLNQILDPKNMLAPSKKRN